jgi:hypothetical protein
MSKYLMSSCDPVPFRTQKILDEGEEGESHMQIFGN